MRGNERPSYDGWRDVAVCKGASCGPGAARCSGLPRKVDVGKLGGLCTEAMFADVVVSEGWSGDGGRDRDIDSSFSMYSTRKAIPAVHFLSNVRARVLLVTTSGQDA